MLTKHELVCFSTPATGVDATGFTLSGDLETGRAGEEARLSGGSAPETWRPHLSHARNSGKLSASFVGGRSRNEADIYTCHHLRPSYRFLLIAQSMAEYSIRRVIIEG